MSAAARRLTLTAAAFLLAAGCGEAPPKPKGSPAETPPPGPPTPAGSDINPKAEALAWIAGGGAQKLESVPFAEVIAATAGHRLLPIDAEASADAEILAAVSRALDAALAEMNADGSPVRGLRRINEASRFFEDALREALDAMPGFACAVPEAANGRAQRSGYPDLRLEHLASARVTYLDPKLFEETSADSTLRTFYYEPRAETNKIDADGHHLLLGISHDGNDGGWRFTGWKIVDLARFRVRLKAEFQGSNRDLYGEGMTVRESGGKR